MKNRMAHQLASPESSLSRRRQRLSSNTLLSAGIERLRLRTLSSSKKPPIPLRIDVPPVPCAPHPPASHPAEAVPSVLVVGPPESGSLPPNLSQLRGIHYVSDPDEDPNLDGETTTNTIQTQSTIGALSMAPAQEFTPSQSPNDSGSFLLTMEGPGNTHPEDSRLTPMASLSPTDEDPRSNKYLFPTDLSPDGKLSNFPAIRRLSPRACQAACPPIDLVSPHAPYAPTPPLSPRGEQVSPGSATPKRPLAFSFGKSLRRMPSTVTKLTTNVKKSNMHVTHVAYQGNGIESTTSESSAALQVSSPSTSLEGNPLPLDVSPRDSCSKMGHGSASASTYSIRSEISSVSTRITQSHNTSGRINSRLQPLPYLASPPTVPEIAVGPFEQQDRSGSNKSPFRGNLNTLVTIPMHRLRKSSSLSTILRSIKSCKHLRAEVPSDPSSTFEAQQRHLSMNVPTDSCCEVLDATAVSSRPVDRRGV